MRARCEKAEENHDFGYDIAMRVAQVMLQRLQATRMQLLDFLCPTCWINRASRA